ncbi:MAG TPA: hypothetical protein VED17_01160 [Nitrososphaerales archaeon]|nr:hypothetical protein [Nitrososphaerales archaeon]
MTNEKKTSFFPKLEKRLASFLNEDVNFVCQDTWLYRGIFFYDSPGFIDTCIEYIQPFDLPLVPETDNETYYSIFSELEVSPAMLLDCFVGTRFVGLGTASEYDKSVRLSALYHFAHVVVCD